MGRRPQRAGGCPPVTLSTPPVVFMTYASSAFVCTGSSCLRKEVRSIRKVGKTGMVVVRGGRSIRDWGGGGGGG